MLHKKLLTVLLLLGVAASCTLSKTSTGITKYQQAVVYYETKKYYQASQLFNEVLPKLLGKKEEALARFYQAYCSFHQKAYLQSSDRFKDFIKTFPRDSNVEEALYMQAHTLYLESPDVPLDQALTQEAICVFRSYLEHYPEGTYADKAYTQLEQLTAKLALKAFNHAKLYYHLSHYRAAVVSLENFQKDFPDSFHKETAAYLKADAQYKHFKEVQQASKDAMLHLGSYYKTEALSSDSDSNYKPIKKLEKEKIYNFDKKQPKEQYQYFEEEVMKLKKELSAAIRYCQEFLDNYPDSTYVLAVSAIYEQLFTCNNLIEFPKH